MHSVDYIGLLAAGKAECFTAVSTKLRRLPTNYTGTKTTALHPLSPQASLTVTNEYRAGREQDARCSTAVNERQALKGGSSEAKRAQSGGWGSWKRGSEPPPHQLGIWETRCKLPPRGPGGAPEEVGFGGAFRGFKNHQFR